MQFLNVKLLNCKLSAPSIQPSIYARIPSAPPPDGAITIRIAIACLLERRHKSTQPLMPREIWVRGLPAKTARMRAFMVLMVGGLYPLRT
jgi:hypothetical protein